MENLTLNNNDPLVIAARDAEQRLFKYYGLEAKTHHVIMPGTGYRIRVSEIGRGKPVLIVPGNTGDVFPLIPLLAELKGRRIIAINRPGGGLSEGMDHSQINLQEFAVTFITAILDYFELGKVPIIAHSIGGHMSLLTAMAKPDRISALTLLGVPGNIIKTGPPLLLRLFSIPILNDLLFKLISPKNPDLSYKGLSLMGHSGEALAKLPEALADCYFHFQKLPHYKTSLVSLMERGNIFGASRDDRITSDQLRSVIQPVQFLWGDNDPFGSDAMGREIAALIPISEFNAIKHGGHLPWLDGTEKCGKLAMAFLANY